MRDFTTPRLAWQWGTALAALALLIAGSWLVFENKRLRQQVSQTESRRDALVEREQTLQKELDRQRTADTTTEQELARVREERDRLEQELKQEQRRMVEPQRTAKQQQPPSGPSGGSIASFILTPQLRGAGQLQTISIPAETDYVAMQLGLDPNDYPAYQIALLNPSGNQILWRSGTLKARTAGDGKTLSISFPARLLKPGVYTLQVKGVAAHGGTEILSDYPFKVVR